ncbi:RHS repeat domain-containing protein [Dyadobacter sp. BHUBP1]|uniref:RHS repeat domain-containing protein n=1 Tax=Dyadobacter sp. BHUBP1 TaxID=3424178 RepID=UPI003D343B2A
MRLRLQFVFLLVASRLIWSQPDAKAQSTDRNYIISRSYKVATTSTSGNVKEANQSVSYVDGLGRPIQSVLAHGSAQIVESVPGDLVTHVEYDSYGRISKNYGSYAVQGGNGVYQSNAPVKAVEYYNSGANFCQPNNRGYEQLEYEQSHLNRVKKRYQVGSDRATEFSYGVNVANEVKWYDVSGSTVVTTKSYTAGELSYVETKDENTKRNREYKDKNGRVVLRRAYNGSATLDTYYVYDDLGQLRFVLQPQYQESAELDKYAFRYEYNDRGLVSSKYVPGGGTTLMSYDARDRMTQSVDGRGKITYFKYDDQNRVIEIGEKRGTVEEGLVKTHYDNYTPPFGNVDTFVASGDGYAPTSRSNVTGYVTVTATRIINPNGDYGAWLYATTYYDDRYNVIQVIRGLFDIGGTSKEYHSKLVSFHGRIEKELIKQETGTGNYSVEKIYTYDHSDRLLSTRYLVKKGTATTSVTKKDIILSAVRYDGLGMPKSKFLYSSDNGTRFREQLDNCFVPTGWLSKVTGKTSASDNFGVELKYTNPATATAQYNGNIAEMLWRRGGSTWVGFKFTYDDVNRLTNAEGIDGNKYRETISEYDKNGNIKFLQRYDDTTPWDNLTYSYGDKGRLMKVTDSGNSNGFNNGSSGTDDDYVYDGNGNATKDLNRGIAAGNLSYNHLNLIREVIVNGQTVQYYYDGNGQKLRMSNTNGAVNTKYAGIFEYDKSNYVTRIATEEGQIAVTNNGNDYESQFYLKDHLGNVRMVMNEQGAMVQETEYFPFGLAIPRIAGVNKYTFLGRERQPETGYMDLLKRFYDPATGRFIQVDPVTETQEHLSLYQYGWNNPILRSDPNGDCPNCITAAIGAGVGALFGGGLEAGIQIYKYGKVKNWKAVGGAVVQGGITGGAAGFTGGGSLLVTTGVSAGSNAVGGAINSVIQGKEITVASIATDAGVGAAGGATGKVLGGVVKSGLDKLSNTAKGKLGETITQLKYGAKGYVSQGKAVVETGGRTATGRVQVAKYDHAMQNVITGRQLTVESKFNSSGLTGNQIAAESNITTGKLIIDRTTSADIGNAVGAATTGAISGTAANINKGEH